METKFLDFEKLTCKTHSFELITNYCLKGNFYIMQVNVWSVFVQNVYANTLTHI